MEPGECAPSYAPNPVRYANGQLLLVETDLVSGGFGLPWGHQRSYGNLLGGLGANGFNWVVWQMPRLQFNLGTGSDIAVFRSANDNLWFKPATGGGYEPRFPTRYQLLEVTDDDTFVLTSPGGIQEVYYDNSSAWDEALRGRLKAVIDRFGHVCDVIYNLDFQPVRFEWLDEATGATLGFFYEHLATGDNAGRLAAVLMSVDGQDTRRVLFDYCVTGEAGGRTGDLKRATVEEFAPETAVWRTVRQTYYRYHLSGGGGGLVHGLKFRLGPEAYAQLVGAGINPDTCTDAVMAEYADLYLEYDNQRRVVLEKIRGGSMTFSYSYLAASPAPAFDDYNTWSMKTEETRPDGSKVTVYTNRALQTLLSKTRNASGSQKQYRQHTYNAAGRVLENVSSAAVQSVAEPATAGQPLTVSLWVNKGLIRQNAYFSTTDAGTGAVAGYRELRAVRRGGGGTPKKKQSYAYRSHSARGAVIHPVWKRRDYPSASMTDAQAPTTSFASLYFHSDGSEGGSLGLTDPVLHAANDVSNDIVIEQEDTVYDAAGHVLQVTSKQRFHDAVGNGQLFDVFTEPKARVSYQALWHDAIGRLRVTANYGTNGAVTFVRPAVAPQRSDTVLVSSRRFAADGQPAASIDPNGIETRWVNDAAGRRIKLIENAAGCGECKNDERITEYGYTPDGLMKRLILRNAVTGNQVTRWVYGTTLDDSLVARSDLLRAKIYPMADDEDYPLDDGIDGEYERIEYTYNRQGQSTTMKDPNGTVHAYDYDQLGRQVQDRVITLAAGIDGAVLRISRAYEPRGMLRLVTSHGDSEVGMGTVLNEVALKYDGFGNLIEDAQAHGGEVDGSTPKVTYTYGNGSGNTARRTGVGYPGGGGTGYSYGAEPGDIDDCLSRVSGVSGVSYRYMGAARLVPLDYTSIDVRLSYLSDKVGTGDLLPWPGDAGDQYTGYDRFGRTVDMRWNRVTGGHVVDHFQYGYDRAGNRLWKKNAVLPRMWWAPPEEPERVVPQDEHYGYDGLYQVKSYQQGYLNESRTAIGGQPIKTELFAYDPAGNWERWQVGESFAPVISGQTRVHNRDNQLVQMNGSSANLAYDKAGNMKQTPDSTFGYNVGGGPMTLGWDAWNRLGSGISYDGLSRRITVGLGNQCYYNDQWKPVEERKYEATAPYCEYYWGARHRDDLTLRRRDSDDDGELDETIWVTHDYFNPATLLLEMDEPYHHGDPVLRMGFSPFGMMRYLGPAEISPGDLDLGLALEEYDWSYGFQGQFVDRWSGLYNYGYRDYSPSLGRWMSRDPIGEEGGLNLYAMINNNPVNGVDHLGLSPIDPGACGNCGVTIYVGHNEHVVEILKNRENELRKTPNGCVSYGSVSCTTCRINHFWEERNPDNSVDGLGEALRNFQARDPASTVSAPADPRQAADQDGGFLGAMRTARQKAIAEAKQLCGKGQCKCEKVTISIELIDVSDPAKDDNGFVKNLKNPAWDSYFSPTEYDCKTGAVKTTLVRR